MFYCTLDLSLIILNKITIKKKNNTWDCSTFETKDQQGTAFPPEVWHKWSDLRLLDHEPLWQAHHRPEPVRREWRTVELGQFNQPSSH